MDLVNGPLAPARALLERIVSVRSRFGHHSVAIDKYRSFFCSPFSHFRIREGIFLKNRLLFISWLVGKSIIADKSMKALNQGSRAARLQGFSSRRHMLAFVRCSLNTCQCSHLFFFLSRSSIATLHGEMNKGVVPHK